MPLGRTSSPRHAIGALGTCLLWSLWAEPALAYCRTTTCDPNVSCATHPTDCCAFDVEGCDTNGLPISWPSACVSYNVQEDGSSLWGITSEELSQVLKNAYDSWLSLTCSDGNGVSLSIDDRGEAQCALPEFNAGPKDRNANIWMFDEEISGGVSSQMSIDATTLAVTLVSFNFKTAEIYDVDVQLNSGLAHFTTGETGVDIDLWSVVTHEAGHFLGLDHSFEPGATMASGYTPGDLGPRQLGLDDRQGICATYPIDRAISRNTCDPRGKYSTKCDTEGCDCRMSPGRSPAPTGAWLATALGLACLLRRRSRS